MALVFEHWNSLEEDFYNDGEIVVDHPYFTIKLRREDSVEFHYLLTIRRNAGVRVQSFSAANPHEAFAVLRYHYEEMTKEEPDEI